MTSWLRRRAGVRVRVAVAAATLVVVSVAVLGIGLVVFLGRSLEHEADAAATQRAAELATALREDGPDGVTGALGSAIGETTVAQLVDASGAVVASSPQIAGEARLLSSAADPGQVSHQRVSSLPVGDGAAYRIVDSAVGDYQILVAQSLQAAENSIQTVTTVLAVGLPLLAVIAGSVTFVSVGRSLRPVEAMRREVAGITARDLDRRLLVPEAVDEISRLAATMNDMLARIQVAQEAQRQFVADASHELRSPLATVRASLQLAGAHPDPDAWEQAHAVLVPETERIERIVAGLLLLARADASALRPGAEDVDLDDLVEEERRRVRMTTSLTVRGTVAAVRCQGDRHQLAQALRNLVDNATAHARGRIELSLTSQGGWARIEVADDGPGVPVADRRRVLGRFIRLDPGRDRGVGGTGLGLAIVDEIARAHGGSVDIGGDPGEGAHVTVWLPLGPPVEGSHPPSAANR